MRFFGIMLLAVLPAAAQQYRAFWVDAFHAGFKTSTQVDQLITDLLQAKANAVFVEVRNRGASYYLRSLEPPIEDPDWTPGFDCLQYLIDRAHPQGIEVHAWFPVYPVYTTAQVWKEHGTNAAGDQMWMTQTAAGKTGTSFDPGHPDALKYLVDVMVNVAGAYEVDGLHLDYVRYPEDADYGWNPTAVARFNRYFDRQGSPAANDTAWSWWRRQQVRALVRQLYLRAFAIRPSVKISAAVVTWGDGPATIDEYRKKDAYSRVYQDWRGMLEEGALDLAMPMNYFREQQYPKYFDHWIEFEKDQQYNRATLIGPAVYLNAINDSLAQLRRAMTPSAAGNRALGVAFYSYAVTNSLSAPNSEFFSQVGAQFGEAAALPELPWKAKPTRGHLYGWLQSAEHDNVEVQIEPQSGGPAIKVSTDGTGFYGYIDLPPDFYLVRLLRDGAEVARSGPQRVDAGAAVRFDIMAEVAQ